MVNMANPFFQFKQFTIHQAISAMKVTTDACVLGALANRYARTLPTFAYRGLDIGAGTGLLSLMLTQDTTIQVDAVESAQDAARECAENVQASPFSNRITVHPIRIETFPQQPEVYDIVICNPPFFKSSLHSPDQWITQARHENELTIQQVMQEISSRMKTSGVAFVLMQASRDEDFRNVAQKEKLFVHESFYIQHSAHHTPFRIVYQLKKHYATEGKREFIIRDNQHAYTSTFRELLQPFYLKL